jgi:hypothetical protein
VQIVYLSNHNAHKLNPLVYFNELKLRYKFIKHTRISWMRPVIFSANDLISAVLFGNFCTINTVFWVLKPTQKATT